MKIRDILEELDEPKEDPYGAFYGNGSGNFRVMRLAYVNHKYVIPPGIDKVVDGELACTNMGLTTLEGAPNIVKDDFYCQNNQLKNFAGDLKEIHGTGYFNKNPLESLEGSLRSVRHMCVKDCGLTNLKGIHRHFDYMETFSATGNDFQSHMLGLLLINGLQEIVLHFQDDGGLNRLLAIEKIINSYLPNTRGMEGVLDCQEKLIDIGAEEYAKL